MRENMRESEITGETVRETAQDRERESTGEREIVKKKE